MEAWTNFVMTWHNIFVEVVVINFYFSVGFEIIWHKQPWRWNVFELAQGVIHTPHENWQQRLLQNSTAVGETNGTQTAHQKYKSNKPWHEKASTSEPRSSPFPWSFQAYAEFSSSKTSSMIRQVMPETPLLLLVMRTIQWRLKPTKQIWEITTRTEKWM